MLAARLVGLVNLTDEGKDDDRVICVHVDNSCHSKHEHTTPSNDLLAATVLGPRGRPLSHNALQA